MAAITMLLDNLDSRCHVSSYNFVIVLYVSCFTKVFYRKLGDSISLSLTFTQNIENNFTFQDPNILLLLKTLLLNKQIDS